MNCSLDPSIHPAAHIPDIIIYDDRLLCISRLTVGIRQKKSLIDLVMTVKILLNNLNNVRVCI
jgi:hypothetical protein